TITLTASGGGYFDVARTLTLSIADNDIPELLLSSSALSLAEGGGGGGVSVRLRSRPSAEVQIEIASSDDGALGVDANAGVTGVQTRMSFSPDSWDTPQRFALTPAADDDAGDEAVTVSLSAAGGGYDGVTASVAVAVTDDESLGLVLSAGALTVTEGSSGSFDVSLKTQPSAAVTVTLGQSGTANSDVGISPTSLSFSTSDWSTAKSVTVTAGEDADAVNDSAVISLSAAGGDYAGESAELPVSVTDNDGAMLALSSTRIDLAEGATGSFNVKLAAAPPAAGLRVTLMQPANTDVSVDTNPGSPGSQSVLLFDSGNWSAGLDVSVSARRDPTLDDETAHIGLSIAGGDSAGVQVDVSDGDEAQLSGLPALIDLDEGASTALDAVALTARPSAEVEVRFSVPAGSPVTLTPASLSFAPGAWNAGQRLSLAAAQDGNAAGEVVTVSFTASGGGFDALAGSFRIRISDDDSIGLKVSALGVERLAEGAERSGTIALESAPSSPVTVTLSSDSAMLRLCDPGARSVGCSDPVDTELTFTAADWDIPQAYRVVAVDDDRINSGSGTLTFSAAGGGYDGQSHSISLTAVDDETPALALSASQISVGEGTVGGDFTVALGTQPSGNVSIAAHADAGDGKLISVSPASLSFTEANWKTPQTFHVVAVEDDDRTDEIDTISLTASGGGYLGAGGSVEVEIADHLPSGPAEPDIEMLFDGVWRADGSNGHVQVRLLTEPSVDQVVLRLKLSDSSRYGDLGESSKATISRSNWRQAVTLSIRTPTDSDTVDNQLMAIVTASGGNYEGFSKSVPVTIYESSERRVAIVPANGTGELHEQGEAIEYIVRLLGMGVPNADVDVALSMSAPTKGAFLVIDEDGDEGPKKNRTLEFEADTGKWNLERNVRVRATLDLDSSNNFETIRASASGGEYNGLTASAPMTIIDVAPPEFRIAQSAPFLEAAPVAGANSKIGQFAVTLTGEPVGPVTFTVTSSDTSRADSTSFSLVRANWNSTGNTVDITGAVDTDTVHDQVTFTFTANGGGYSDISRDITVTLYDKDTAVGSGAAILVSPADSTRRIIEVGEPGSYSVRLAKAPTASVTVTVASADPGAVAVDTDTGTAGNQSRLTFTTGNWSTPQSFSVAAVLDDDSDDENVALLLTAASTDSSYAGLSAGETVAVSDDNTRPQKGKFRVDYRSGTYFGEGIRAGFRGLDVYLLVQPTADVTLTLTINSNASKIQLVNSTVTFPRNAWEDTVRYLNMAFYEDDDTIDDEIRMTITASGGNYDGLSQTFTRKIYDNDAGRRFIFEPEELSPEGIEGGRDIELNGVLTQAPTGGDATFRVTSSDPGAATVRFDTTYGEPPRTTEVRLASDTRYYTPLRVLVTPVEDDDFDDETVTITLSASGGGYSGSISRTLKIKDSDTPPAPDLRISGTVSGLENDADGIGGVGVALTQRPSGQVTIVATSSDPSRLDFAAGSSTAASHTFTRNAGNWDLPSARATLYASADADSKDDHVTLTFV
ncbi:MAG: hypothetical protein ISN29_08540, partial [Gammaproteobacteria bacterium AqS3]|nr:hypothetical protein [Gammaproteobacteria bacterium AqS3]